MNFNRRPFQFSPDFGFEHASSSFRDHFDESSEVNDMFSAGAPPGRWDAADLPRFHVPGFGHDFNNDPFSLSSGQSFFSNPRGVSREVPIKVSHYKSGPASDDLSRAKGATSSSTGTTGSGEVYIPIHVEGEVRKNNQARPESSGAQHQEFHHRQQQSPVGKTQTDAQHGQEEVVSEKQQPQQQHTYSYRSSLGEDSPHRFSTMPPRGRTFAGYMTPGKAGGGIPIPVHVERSDSSPVIGDDRFGQQKSPERGSEAQSNTGTFPRTKSNEAPLRWIQGMFRGPRVAEQPGDPHAASPPPSNPEPAPPQQPVQKAPVSPQERIDKVLLDLADLNGKVNAFKGTDQKAKEYRFLDEMLTRLMLSLDDVITDGNETLRAHRKSAIKEVQRVIDKLEKTVQTNAEAAQKKNQQKRAPALKAQKEEPAVHAPVDKAPSCDITVTASSPKEASPPRRDKSPMKKRQASPIKKDKRSPSPKKEVGLIGRQCVSSCTKESQTPSTITNDSSATCDGVSVTVNGTPVSLTSPVDSAAADSSNTDPMEKMKFADDSQTDEPTTPEPIVSTASIELKK
ncbi:BAG domain-containing protein Samui-like [Varroa destructor]|uniref:BAG domain-containing protein n=1 Tax=Varroa destructor TaxID=109461 RepID=A0A7M7KAK7_VARDE|nr:BAG domain-containing protein Samui-like [Varroa destructor]